MPPKNFAAGETRAVYFIFTSIVLAICNGNSTANPVQLLYANTNSIQWLHVDFADVQNTTQINFQAFNLVKNHQPNAVEIATSRLTAIDFSYQTKSMFWSDSEKIYGSRLNSPDRSHTKITNDLISPSGLAYDWVTDKIYWADSTLRRIEVYQKRDEQKNRKVLYWQNIMPEMIAIVPHRRLIFWTNVNENANIESSSMDGDHSARKVVIGQRISHPISLVVDYDLETIYWYDLGLSKLERADLDGLNRVSLFERSSYQFSALTLSGDLLFLADEAHSSVSVCNKSNCQSTIVPILSDGQGPVDIRAFSKQRQLPMDSPCANKSENGGCSHLCLLSSTKQLNYSCACPTGIKLLEDGKTCAPSLTEMLILSTNEGLRLISLDTPDRVDVSIPLRGTSEPLAIDFDSTDGFIYWAIKKVIRKGKLNDLHVHRDPIVKGIVYSEGIAVDWIAKNVYWIDAKSRTIGVARTDASYSKVLIFDLKPGAKALTIHPWRGYIFWTYCGVYSQIERASLDGSTREVIVESSLSMPKSLTIDIENNQLYWYDLYFELIESASLDGRHRKMLVKVPAARGLALLGNWIYWTQIDTLTNETVLKRANKLSGEKVETAAYQLPGIVAMKGVANDTPYYFKENTCNNNNGNCSQFCFFKPQNHNLSGNSHICSCSVGYALAADGFSCASGSDRSPREPKSPCRVNRCSHDCQLMEDGRVECLCPPNFALSTLDNRTCIKYFCRLDQFHCGNYRCIPQSQYCDGNVDCDDASDEENCCKSKTDFFCPSSYKCIPQEKVCDSVRDCEDGWDELCCTSTIFNCNSTQYSLRRRCIPSKQVCDGEINCENGSDEYHCSPILTTHITTHTTTHTLTWIFCTLLAFLLVFFAVAVRVKYSLSKEVPIDGPGTRQLLLNPEGSSCNEATLAPELKSRPPTHELKGSPSAPELRNLDDSIVALRRVSPGTSLISFSSSSARTRESFNSNVTSYQPYDRASITGTSSKSSSYAYSLLHNPPPSPVTSTYSVNGISSLMSARYSQYKAGPNPPPTPCSNYLEENGHYNFSQSSQHDYEQISFDREYECYPQQSNNFVSETCPTMNSVGHDFLQNPPPSPTEPSNVDLKKSNFPLIVYF